jgi:hypothetical protein
MNKYSNTLISGLIWIGVSVAVGWAGLELTESSGIWFFLGWVIAITSFAFGGMSVWYLVRSTYFYLVGGRLKKGDFVDAMVEMAEESGRTHRGMVNTYLSDVQDGILPSPPADPPEHPSGRGLFKARFFGALFMVVAYAYASGDESGTDELLQAASGIAIKPLVEEENDVHLEREEAKPIAESYMSPTLEAIRGAFKQAPITPDNQSTEFDALAEQLHEALEDSIGGENYTTEVKQRFDVMVRGNCAEALNHSVDWASS